ncbi:unnamed protein product, partial [Ectocarpus sp. 12 AP-2014]
MRERQHSPLRLVGRHPRKSSKRPVLPRKAVQARTPSSLSEPANSDSDVSGTNTANSGNQPQVPTSLQQQQQQQQAGGGSRRGGDGGTTRRRSRGGGGGGGSSFPPAADDGTVADMAAKATTTTPVPDRRNSAKARTSSTARGSVNRSAGATPPSGGSRLDPSHNTPAASGSANGKGRVKSGAGGSSSNSSAARANGTKGGYAAKSGGAARGGSSKGGNANHLLNFQFQPIANVAAEGGGGGRARRGGGGGGGSGRSKGGGGVWGGGATRGPMSKEQFLQANFHFLLNNPSWSAATTTGDARSASPGLQEAFFDPDVLVDWDTVDTVRLFRRVSGRKQAVSPPPAVMVKPNSTPAATGTLPPPQGTSDASGCLSDAGGCAGGCAGAGAAPKKEGGSAEREGVPPGFKGLTVLRAAAEEEVSWGSSSSGKRPTAAAATAAREASAATESPVALAMPEGVQSNVEGVQSKVASSVASPSGDGAADDDCAQGEETGEEGDWTCPICLGVPVAPRVTKCGHGPFCLVCILRHLHGEASARCPLCFDKMHRNQLRRAACRDVHPYVPGGTASLLLLRRERSSLVPVQSASDKGTASGVPGGATASIPGGGSGGGGAEEEGWAAGGGVCPAEGDESERFSRLVRAAPSTLRDLAAAEQMALLSFRHSSIASGETEWVPYISQAQALVKAQLDRFVGVPPTTITATTATGGLKPQERAAVGRRGSVASGSPAISATPPGTKSISSETPPHGGGSSGDSRSVDSAQRVGADYSSPVGLEDGGGTTVGRVSGGSSSGSLVAAPEAAQPSAKGSSSGDKPSLGTTSNSAAAGAHGGGGGGGGEGGGGPFRFFQSVDGQKAFLHPLDMRQLLDDAERGLPLPPRIDAKVLEVETVKLTPELRKRLPFLGHLPIHCDISFLEVDMSDFVSDETSRKFRE